MVHPSLFLKRNFLRLENAIVKVSESGPVKRGEKSLHLRLSDGKENYYGMQGPSFHLHNLLKWCSPNRASDLFISIDLVPAIQVYDKTLCDNVPLFKQECPCKEHCLDRPNHCLLLPLKCRELVMSTFHRYGDGDEDYWKAKRQFLESNFMVSLSEYENDILKTWKCEKSIYHNWYICYTLMKCFGKPDHDCTSTVKFEDGQIQIKSRKPNTTYPERNDSFSSYSWKTLIFTKALEESRRYVTIKHCFDCLTSAFERENLRTSQVVTIDSFWCPSEIAETILLTKNGTQEYTPFVESIISLKSMLNEINSDNSYTYEKYKEKLFKLFPELSSHLQSVRS